MCHELGILSARYAVKALCSGGPTAMVGSARSMPSLTYHRSLTVRIWPGAGVAPAALSHSEVRAEASAAAMGRSEISAAGCAPTTMANLGASLCVSGAGVFAWLDFTAGSGWVRTVSIGAHERCE